MLVIFMSSLNKHIAAVNKIVKHLICVQCYVTFVYCQGYCFEFDKFCFSHNSMRFHKEEWYKTSTIVYQNFLEVI